MVSADLSPPFVCRKITPEISITLGVAAFPTFPCKTWRTVYKRNKKLARRFDGRVTLLAGPTILHINTLTRPAEATRSIPRPPPPPPPPPPALYLKEAITVCVSAIVSSWLGQRRIKLISKDFALSLVVKVRVWVGFRWGKGGGGGGAGEGQLLYLA